ncbi:hypothetical protein [Microvirga arsenatis]|nr:hypothetical protein [Microvirga arsenatis]NBJ13031.1 hypothetical protein [Microvirga arsenatis]
MPVLLMGGAAYAQQGSPGTLPEQIPPTAQRTPMGHISGIALAAILAAMPEIQKFGMDVKDYNFRVSDAGDYIVVFLEYKELHPAMKNATGVRGSRGLRPSFSVALEKASLKPVRANFVR